MAQDLQCLLFPLPGQICDSSPSTLILFRTGVGWCSEDLDYQLDRMAAKLHGELQDCGTGGWMEHQSEGKLETEY